MRIFVYGTLKMNGPLGRNQKRYVQKVENAIVPGTLYDINGSYPAAIFGGEKTIIGEIHTYPDSLQLLESFDRIEGYNRKSKMNSLYRRVSVTAITEAGAEKRCFAYEFNRDVTEFPVIVEGVWYNLQEMSLA